MSASALRRGLRQLIDNTGTLVTFVFRAEGVYSTETGSVVRGADVLLTTKAAVTDYTDEVLSGSGDTLGQRKLLLSSELCTTPPKRGDRVQGLGGEIEVMKVKDLIMSGVPLGWIVMCGGAR